MEQTTKVSGLKTKFRGVESKCGQMARSIMGIGKITRCMVLAFTSMWMGSHMQVNLLGTSRRDMGSIPGLMVGNIGAGGSGENNTVMVPTWVTVWCLKTGYGTWVSERNGSVTRTSNRYRMAHMTTRE